LYVPARAAGLNIETATIADLNAAFAEGTLTFEQLVSAYLKRVEAYDKQGPAINAELPRRMLKRERRRCSP
jgi:amidase